MLKWHQHRPQFSLYTVIHVQVMDKNDLSIEVLTCNDHPCLVRNLHSQGCLVVV